MQTLISTPASLNYKNAIMVARVEDKNIFALLIGNKKMKHASVDVLWVFFKYKISFSVVAPLQPASPMVFIYFLLQLPQAQSCCCVTHGLHLWHGLHLREIRIRARTNVRFHNAPSCCGICKAVGQPKSAFHGTMYSYGQTTWRGRLWW